MRIYSLYKYFFTHDILYNNTMSEISSRSDYDSSDDIYSDDMPYENIIGGKSDKKYNVPMGCFPPIFISNKSEKQKEMDKNRAFAVVNTAMKIHEVLDERRTDSFITME